MKKILLAAVLLLAACSKGDEILKDPADWTYTDGPVEQFPRRCWVCELHVILPLCGTIEVDTVCGKTDQQIADSIAALYISNPPEIEQWMECNPL